MDYKRFLAQGAAAPIALPYFGGTRVDAADRKLRVDREGLAPGWWTFRVDGRLAVPLEPADAADLAKLPAKRGHWFAGWVHASGRDLARAALPPADEPAPFARVTLRRWHSGDWLYDTTDFEDEPELAARAALLELRPLAGVRDVVPSLRAAFGLALGLAIARELDIEIDARELAPFAVEIADGGREIVRSLCEDLIEARRRAMEAARMAAARVAALTRVQGALASVRGRARDTDPARRADDALDAAGARMLAARRVHHGAALDVTWQLDGVRLYTLVDAATLQVIDPGVCLDGAHEVLTLDAMPSVIREAIANDLLNITRRS